MNQAQFVDSLVASLAKGNVNEHLKLIDQLSLTTLKLDVNNRQRLYAAIMDNANKSLRIVLRGYF